MHPWESQLTITLIKQHFFQQSRFRTRFLIIIYFSQYFLYPLSFGFAAFIIRFLWSSSSLFCTFFLNYFTNYFDHYFIICFLTFHIPIISPSNLINNLITSYPDDSLKIFYNFIVFHKIMIVRIFYIIIPKIAATYSK